MRKLLILSLFLAMAGTALGESSEEPFFDWFDSIRSFLETVRLDMAGWTLGQESIGSDLQREQGGVADPSLSGEPEPLPSGMAGMITPVGLTTGPCGFTGGQDGPACATDR